MKERKEERQRKHGYTHSKSIAAFSFVVYNFIWSTSPTLLSWVAFLPVSCQIRNAVRSQCSRRRLLVLVLATSLPCLATSCKASWQRCVTFAQLLSFNLCTLRGHSLHYDA